MPRSPSHVAGADLAVLYSAHAAGVRRHLQHFGASAQDMDDLVQEVFLVLHAKREQLRTIKPFEPWLREVSRRVAAGERRRAHRRREVASGEPPETPDDARGSDRAVEEDERADRLHHALSQLDEHARDLVALRELGDLSLEEVASLVEADRKTVRKRLSAAIRRLDRLLGAAPPPPPLDPRESPSERSPVSVDFQVLVRHPDISLGLVGSVLISVWPGPATLAALEQVDVAMARTVELCAGGFAYLPVVETVTQPPNLAARQKIVALLEKYAPHVGVYACAIEADSAWIVRPIMTGLSILARPPFPMQYFHGVPSAARWLAEKHARFTNVPAATLVETTDRLRS